MAITTAQIEKAYANISEDDFDIIDDFDVGKRVETIARLYRLTTNQTDIMTMATMMLAMNGATQEDFFSELADVGLTGIQAKELEKEINDVVLDPLREKLEAKKAETHSIEEVDSGIEIIDEPEVEETISIDQEKAIETNERDVLAKEDIVIEEEQPQKEEVAQRPIESRDTILEDLEHPQKSEGVALDRAVPISTPSRVTSIPIRPIPTIFETGPMGPAPKSTIPEIKAPIIVPEKSTVIPATPTVEKISAEVPDTLPVEPNEPPVAHTIPIIPTAPVVASVPVKKTIENPGPIGINIPKAIIEKVVPPIPIPPEPVAMTVPIKEEPVVILTPTAISPQTPAVQDHAFKDIPKVNIIDVGSLAPVKQEEGNPLERPEIMKAAQERLRKLARERQQSFISQKMSTTFSLPKTETTVGTASTTSTPLTQTDPYKETL